MTANLASKCETLISSKFEDIAAAKRVAMGYDGLARNLGAAVALLYDELGTGVDFAAWQEAATDAAYLFLSLCEYDEATGELAPEYRAYKAR